MIKEAIKEAHLEGEIANEITRLLPLMIQKGKELGLNIA